MRPQAAGGRDAAGGAGPPQHRRDDRRRGDRPGTPPGSFAAPASTAYAPNSSAPRWRKTEASSPPSKKRSCTACHDGALVTDNTNREFESSLTIGERVADKVAQFGGSWRFIIVFFGTMTLWIVVNSVFLLKDPFDPYPYILLNLGLSMLAAVQAPVILMSQNRQEDRDRMRAENDYQVNLKAELEIRAINEKLDQLIHQQWSHLLEIQQIQMEMIEDLTARSGPRPLPPPSSSARRCAARRRCR